MKMRRFALKGILILAAVLLICAFLSGTIMSLTCAKVKLVTPRMGKPEQKIELDVEVYFPETEDIQPLLPAGITYTITEVNSRAGYTASSGDVILKAEVTGFDEKSADLRKSYTQAEEALSKLERQEAQLRIREKDEEYVRAYRQRHEASEALLLARVTMNVYLEDEGLTYESHEGASEKCIEAVSAFEEAALVLSRAENEWKKLENYNIEETVYTYLTDKYTYQKQMRDAEEGLAELIACQTKGADIACPYDCYIVKINVQKGDTWDGSAPLFQISDRRSTLYLRSDITDREEKISKNSTVTVKTGRYGMEESRVRDIKTDTEGKQYAYIDLNQDIIDGFGSLYAVMQEKRTATIVNRSQDPLCLVPVSAVHGSGNERHVFTVETKENSLGAKTMTVHKLNVSVKSEIESIAALEDDISWYTLAYMEDRELTDGEIVMEYSD